MIFATWLGIGVNVLLTAAKGAAGFAFGSKGLLADAAHSASDIVGSIVVLFGIRIAAIPGDEDHPYGHGKAEHVASLIVGFLLILTALQIAISSLSVFRGEPPEPPGTYALPIIIASILVKELLFRYKFRLGRKYDSAALFTEAWHHRSDALSSLAVLVGIGAAVASKALAMPFLTYADAAAGVFVSIMVARVGYTVARESATVMMEQVLSEEDAEKFIDTARQVPGVLGVDELLARLHGHYVVIDIKISVDPRLSVKEGHDIGVDVRRSLIGAHSEVRSVLVHTNPYRGPLDD